MMACAEAAPAINLVDGSGDQPVRLSMATEMPARSLEAGVSEVQCRAKSAKGRESGPSE